MSAAGYHRSPQAPCPSCGVVLHPGLYGDLRAHVQATGVLVKFACPSCGIGLRIDPVTREVVEPEDES